MTRAPFFMFALGIALPLATAPSASAQAADPSRTHDAAFVAKAADITSVDTDLATLAVTRSTSNEVKVLARRVMAARTQMMRDLEAMAGGRQMPSPPRPDADQQAATPAAALRAQPPAAFDAAFVAALVANGEAAVALFDTESRDGRDDEIKEWAARQLPALREHLTAIRSLRP